MATEGTHFLKLLVLRLLFGGGNLLNVKLFYFVDFRFFSKLGSFSGPQKDLAMLKIKHIDFNFLK